MPHHYATKYSYELGLSLLRGYRFLSGNLSEAPTPSVEAMLLRPKPLVLASGGGVMDRFHPPDNIELAHTVSLG
jgi:hypothetical protein